MEEKVVKSNNKGTNEESFVSGIYARTKKMRTYMLAVSMLGIMLPISVYFFFEEKWWGTAATVIYSLLLALLCVLEFIGANTVGVKELNLKEHYHPAKWKGFLHGLAAEIYVIVLTIVMFLLRNVILSAPEYTDTIKNYFATIFALQYSVLLQLFDYSIIGYILAFAVVPVCAEIGYLLAYKHIDIDDKIGGLHKS